MIDEVSELRLRALCKEGDAEVRAMAEEILELRWKLNDELPGILDRIEPLLVELENL